MYIKYQRLDTAQKTIKLHSPIIQTHGSEIYFQLLLLLLLLLRAATLRVSARWSTSSLSLS
jgi:hypothetical protein